MPGAGSGRAGGFTRVELLAVTAIIAILATVAVPNIVSALQQALAGKAAADIGTIRDAVEIYRYRHGGALPVSIAALVPVNPAIATLDPWGNPYVFNNFALIPPEERRTDRLAVPINREYDIYSSGADGLSTPGIRASNAGDDIIMAGDGAFIGKAAEY